jgi:hypothetical protein
MKFQVMIILLIFQIFKNFIKFKDEDYIFIADMLKQKDADFFVSD